jgi:hypothetical protein
MLGRTWVLVADHRSSRLRRQLQLRGHFPLLAPVLTAVPPFRYPVMSIAIVATACRYPDAPPTVWRNVLDGRRWFRVIPPDV